MRATNTTSSPFDPIQREEDADIFGPVLPDHATILEDGDTANAIFDNLVIAPGDFFIGTIASPSDADLIAVELTAGVSYTIDLFGVDSGGGLGTLADPFLELLDASGDLMTFNGSLTSSDNDGIGRDSLVVFTPTTTGTYYIAVTSADGGTGRYTVQVSDDLPPPPPTLGTLQDMVTQLQSGYTGGTEYTFDTSSSNVITVNISALTAEGQKLALWAMETWEMVADLEFQTVTSGEMITIDDEQNGAYASFPGIGASQFAGGVEVNVSSALVSVFGASLGSLPFQTYVQQFGQALGLGYLGNYVGTGSYPEDAIFTNDSWQLSVMSSFAQNVNPTVDASYGFVTTAMMVDILAIQDFYGAAGAGSATAGNTVYGLGSNLGNYLDDIFASMVADTAIGNASGNPVALTLYDSDGTDLLDLSYLGIGVDARIDLNGGTFSDIGESIGLLGIALGTVIENLITGEGNDTVTGNSANNTLTTGAGDDLILSGAGNDTSMGGSGNDTIYGGGGNDSLSATSGFNEMFGGAGSDAITGGKNSDLLGGGSGNDTINGGGGNDTMWGSSGNDAISGGNGNDFSGAGANRDTVNGGGGIDTLYGGGGQDTVMGDANDDLLGGGTGADLVQGGTGSDTLWGQAGADTLEGGQGNDDIAGGSQGDLLLGEAGDDTLSGGFGNDTLSGGADDDVLNGNFGNDVLTGGLGADVFIMENSGGKIITDFNGAEGDTLQLDDALWGGGLTTAQVVAAFASESSGDIVFDFGGGSFVVLEGVTTTVGLSDDIELF
ncbi:M10 family metallopeptidase C-terminal domain-containing protein [uncultured Tateyamaria sp.]|uniref:pre-peptidase C-terminal domain-containing protein n=1 Tax=uncultured Tateyamaria sp. TaxID=455651 RepID=UPI00260A67B8|nr:M10 family metallopeptidase C-terminal domain-containing protein [uncultured Tateyamaria sp.]